jgi:phosphate transport system substrate-binding protein
VACDETFLPILEMEKVIFANTYTQSNLKIKYVPDVELFNLLLKDSVRLIVSSRKLTTKEKAYFEKQKLFPREIHIATDAIAIICNKSIQDSIFTLKELKDILTGKISSWKQISAENDDAPIKIVFDNTNSSTVRMIIDSITKNEPLTKNISAVTKNADVIDVVNQQKNAIGIIGVSWISDMKDSTVRDFLKKVTVISLTKDSVKNSSNAYKPYQAYIATGKYPLTRNIYIILTEPRHGLASGFCSFLASDRGQRVILKSGILPATQPLRIINMREEL